MSEPPTAPRAASALRFGPGWRETVTLDDGTRIRLRLVVPEDKGKLAEGIAALSPQSRYLRFFTDKPRLTEAELRYLTELDQWDHFAIAAGRLDDDDQEGEGVGVARFVRLGSEPEVAEPAVAVIDAMQGRGLGHLLLERLVEAAVERGVRRFRTEFLAINRPMKQLLTEISPQAVFSNDGPVVVAEFSLPSATPERALAESPDYLPLRKMLRLMAEQVVELRRRLIEQLDPARLRASLQRLAAAAVGLGGDDDEDEDDDDARVRGGPR